MYFQFNSHIHDYNTRSTNNLHPAIFRTNFSQFSVRFQGRSYPCIFDTPAQQCIIFSSDGSCYFNCLSLYSDGLYFYLSFVHSSCTFPSEVCFFFTSLSLSTACILFHFIDLLCFFMRKLILITLQEVSSVCYCCMFSEPVGYRHKRACWCVSELLLRVLACPRSDLGLILSAVLCWKPRMCIFSRYVS